MDNKENISDNEYALMIGHLLCRQQQETIEMIQNLEEELRLTNRFFPNSKVTDMISLLSETSTHLLKKGTLLYRCRLISKDDEVHIFQPLFNEYSLLMKDFFPNFDEMSTLEEQVKFSIYFERHPEQYEKLKRAFQQQFTEHHSTPRFWGYSESQSDAPPIGCSSSGRINPDGIRYLYAANDRKTAIVEVRPVPTQYVSVAQIEILEDINIYSFAKSPKIDYEGNNWLSVIDYDEISRYFSTPNYGGQSYYLATQYMSEYIKHMKNPDGQAKFDGLCFRSSLNPDGINYVLFDVSPTRKYRICNSALCQVKNLLGDFECIVPISAPQSDE